MDVFHIIILTLHVLGAGLLLGIVFFSFLAVVNKDAIKKHIDAFVFIRKYGMMFSSFQFVTGAILVASEWDTVGHNPLVWAKVVLWALSGFIAASVIGKKINALKEGTLTESQIKAFQNANLLALIVIIVIIILGVIVLETS